MAEFAPLWDHDTSAGAVWWAVQGLEWRDLLPSLLIGFGLMLLLAAVAALAVLVLVDRHPEAALPAGVDPPARVRRVLQRAGIRRALTGAVHPPVHPAGGSVEAPAAIPTVDLTAARAAVYERGKASADASGRRG